MRNLRLIVVFCLLMPIKILAQGDVTIQMSLSQDTIEISEQAILTIVISGGKQDIPSPELPNLSMFNVYSQGTSTNISIVNGKMETSYSYQYMLQPKKAGTFPIGSVNIDYNRTRYKSNELTLTVIDSEAGQPASRSLKQEGVTATGEEKDMFLTADIDKRTAYVNEQMTLSLKFYHAVQLYSQPEYTAPQTTDFWTDMLEPQKTYYTTVNGRRYRVIEITSALFPTRSGDLTIGSAIISATIPVKRVINRKDPFSLFDDFFTQGESQNVRSRPITVKVLPLPSENKPATFSGTVGNFSIEANPDKTTVDMNQPVTVTYKIDGTGNIKTVAEPNIGDLMDFRIYRASTDEKISKLNGMVGGTKIFEEVYIPKRAGHLSIPPVKLDFFDPGTKKYKNISSQPIQLDIQPIAAGEFTDLPLQPVAGLVVEPNAKDIRYIKTEPGNLSPHQHLILFTPLYLLLNGLPVVMLCVIWVNSKRRERFARDIGYARSRAAKKLARRHLSAASKMAEAVHGAEFFMEIRRALFSYVANKLNISPHGLSSDGVLDILKNSGLDETLVTKAGELFKRADFAQYSSVSVSREQIMESYRDAEELLISLEEAKLA